MVADTSVLRCQDELIHKPDINISILASTFDLDESAMPNGCHGESTDKWEMKESFIMH